MIRIFNKRIVIFVVALVLVPYFVTYTLRGYPVQEIQCYYMRNESIDDLNMDQPTEKSIFFLETSCNSNKNGKITIKARQACAVESAARLNPNYGIYLLYTSPGKFKFEDTESDKFLQVLQSYSNVKIRHIDYRNYLKNTIIENLSTENKLEKSFYPVSHASDILRFLTLWKYGGIYLDLDTIVIKSLEVLPLNFAGAESNKLIGSATLSFSAEGAGHDFATLCLQNLWNNFDGNKWDENGPKIITRLTQQLCQSDTIEEAVGKSCYGGQYNLFPANTFNPVPYWDWEKYFDEKYNLEVEMLTRDSYVVHMWNKFSSKRKIYVGEKNSFTNFASKFCPKVFSECKKYF